VFAGGKLYASLVEGQYGYMVPPPRTMIYVFDGDSWTSVSDGIYNVNVTMLADGVDRLYAATYGAGVGFMR